jgi:glycosyltransferase involved in cell wall biosynthesis
LDSLPACWLAARLRRKKLLLDSRERYTQTPFLAHRPVKRWVWEQVERFLYPRVPYILAVSPPIAAYFEQKYHKPVWVIYNLPLRGKGFVKPRLENRLLLYQGMLHPYRGLEELVLALSYAPGWKLWIVGDGPIRTYLEKLVRQQKVEDQVRFLGLVPFEAVVGYTQQATLGVSAELPHALNHRYALPNKAFDYIQQGIPLLVGEAPLLQALVRRYGCGFIVSDWRPKEIAYALREIGNAPAE